MNTSKAERARNDARKALDEAERAFAHDPTDEQWSAVVRAREAFDRANVIAPELPAVVTSAPERLRFAP